MSETNPITTRSSGGYTVAFSGLVVGSNPTSVSPLIRDSAPDSSPVLPLTKAMSLRILVIESTAGGSS